MNILLYTGIVAVIAAAVWAAMRLITEHAEKVEHEALLDRLWSDE